MEILVLATDYPRNDGYVASYFIHTRNVEYIKEGISVTVINFSTKTDYVIDGVNVISLTSYKKKYNVKKYHLLVSHAANIRHHYLFLVENKRKFDRIVFFFHGHEVLKISDIYPEPYSYTKKKNKIIIKLRDGYDKFKLFLWRKYIVSNIEKCTLVFVSEWMYNKFLYYTKINEEIVKRKSTIIYNSVSSVFEKKTYDRILEKKYDFITIRNIFDNSKYAIDIVVNIAYNNPHRRFLLIGQGEYFKFNKKPENLEVIYKHLSHEEIIGFLNSSKYALMPTKADAQGLMMCEMATYGIPVITSNIDICTEVFKGFKNVVYIDNNESLINIDEYISKFNKDEQSSNIKPSQYLRSNTIQKEIKLYKHIVQ